MDELYYRKEHPKRSLALWLNRMWRNKRVRLTTTIVLIILSFMTFSTKGLLQRYRLETQKRDIQNKILEAQQEQIALQQKLKALDTDKKMIEKAAREKYGMIREGETVYKIKKEK